MGRYAFFNSGLEYKFAYSIQDSSDIILFGGRFTADGKIEWSQDDILHIVKTLANMYDFYRTTPFDYSKFEGTLDGTYELKNAFLKDIENCLPDSAPILHRILLGHLILHQLSYEPNLTCSFEV
jgi:hypothetical protein